MSVTITDRAYLVLSVADIRRMLRAAKASQRVQCKKLNNSNHCIILDNLSVVIVDDDKQPQVSSAVMNVRVAELEREAMEKFRAQRNHDMGDAVREHLNIKG